MRLFFHFYNLQANNVGFVSFVHSKTARRFIDGCFDNSSRWKHHFFFIRDSTFRSWNSNPNMKKVEASLTEVGQAQKLIPSENFLVGDYLSNLNPRGAKLLKDDRDISSAKTKLGKRQEKEMRWLDQEWGL